MGASTLTDKNLVTCPKCGKEVWDNRLTKKGNQPDYRCKNRACDGAIWLKKKADIAPTPPFLHNAAAEDAAELAGKIGQPEKPKLTKLYLDATEFVIDKIVPMFEKAEIPLSDTAVIAAVATIFIAASKER